MSDPIMDAVERCKRNESREDEIRRLIEECGERKQREFYEETAAIRAELREIILRKPPAPVYHADGSVVTYIGPLPERVNGMGGT